MSTALVDSKDELIEVVQKQAELFFNKVQAKRIAVQNVVKDDTLILKFSVSSP